MPSKKKEGFPAIKVSFLPLDEIVPYERNPRTHSTEQTLELVANILKFGFTNFPLVDIAAGKKLVAGHGRYDAVKVIYAQGGTIAFPDGTEIPKGTMPVTDCSGWDEATRRAYIIWDNKSAEKSSWDFVLLREELAALDVGDFDMSLTGFDEKEREQIATWANDKPQEDGNGGGKEKTDDQMEKSVCYFPRTKAGRIRKELKTLMEKHGGRLA